MEGPPIKVRAKEKPRIRLTPKQLDCLHSIIKQHEHVLRIELMQANGKKKHLVWSNISKDFKEFYPLIEKTPRDLQRSYEHIKRRIKEKARARVGSKETDTSSTKMDEDVHPSPKRYSSYTSEMNKDPVKREYNVSPVEMREDSSPSLKGYSSFPREMIMDEDRLKIDIDAGPLKIENDDYPPELKIPLGRISQNRSPEVVQRTKDSHSNSNKDKGWEIVHASSRFRGPRLIEANTYIYGMDHKATKVGQRWRCIIRRGNTSCLASVMQSPDGKEFSRGLNPHTCNPSDRDFYITTMASNSEIDLPPTPSRSIKETVNPKKVYTINRPSQPSFINFCWVTEALPSNNFIKDDIRVDSARHILMFTNGQKNLLRTSKLWFVDVTSRAVQAPFQQLWSIHTIICHNKKYKQVPLAYFLMSRNRQEDYVAILNSLQDLLGNKYKVVSVVLDFEEGAWKAFREVMPDVSIRGCAFHWTQAIYDKISSLGLLGVYESKSETSLFMRKLLCLHLLPKEDIPETFKKLLDLISDCEHPAMTDLMTFVYEDFIDSRVFWISCWSVFNEVLRTNKDVENWFHSLNLINADNQTNIYSLVETLYALAINIPQECRLLSEKKLKKYQRKKITRRKCLITNLWDQYRDREINALEFLGDVCEYHFPVNI